VSLNPVHCEVYSIEFIVFNTTFNNISFISWRSVLWVEKSGVHGENHWPAASHRHTLSHKSFFLGLNVCPEEVDFHWCNVVEAVAFTCPVNWKQYIFTDIMLLKCSLIQCTFISWRSVLLVEKTGVHGENHCPAARHRHTLSHNVVSSTPRHERGSNSQI
jgi:hypothetical protein